MAGSWSKTYQDGDSLLESDLDTGFGSVQPSLANLALATTGSGANDVLVSSGSNVPPAWSTPNTFAATITAAGANAIAQTMTASGANAIVADLTSCVASTANLVLAAVTSCVASTANLVLGEVTSCQASTANFVLNNISSCSTTSANIIADQVVRATGTTVSNLGIAISGSCGAFTTTSTSIVLVTNLSVDITTNGRPVELSLRRFPGTANLFAGVLTAQSTGSATRSAINVQFFRDGTLIHSDYFKSYVENGSNAYCPAGSFRTIDAVAAGTYNYTVGILNAIGTNHTASIEYCQLVAHEL